MQSAVHEPDRTSAMLLSGVVRFEKTHAPQSAMCVSAARDFLPQRISSATKAWRIRAAPRIAPVSLATHASAATHSKRRHLLRLKTCVAGANTEKVVFSPGSFRGELLHFPKYPAGYKAWSRPCTTSQVL